MPRYHLITRNTTGYATRVAPAKADVAFLPDFTSEVADGLNIYDFTLPAHALASSVRPTRLTVRLFRADEPVVTDLRLLSNDVPGSGATDIPAPDPITIEQGQTALATVYRVGVNTIPLFQGLEARLDGVVACAVAQYPDDPVPTV